MRCNVHRRRCRPGRRSSSNCQQQGVPDMTTLNPYLGFRDNAKDAMTFYQTVFGGELTMSTFAEYHASEDPAEQEKITHAQLRTDGGMVLMGADTPNSMD